VNDDWRLRIELKDDQGPRGIRERLETADLEHNLAEAFSDRVIVSDDGTQVFCYAGSREQAESARELIESLASDHGWQIETEIRRWHPEAEEWEDPETPLPKSADEHSSEHSAMIERERAESASEGFPEFEVRVQCPSHREAIEFAHQLEREGVPSVRRWHYLLVGAPDEDSAHSLADRIREQAPPGTVVWSEASGRSIWPVRPGNPFAIFGGLGV
jgi:hypothetical protein